MGINKKEIKAGSVPIQVYIPAAEHRAVKSYCAARGVFLREWLAATVSEAVKNLPRVKVVR